MEMSSVSKRTPRKTIEVMGGLSLSGEDWRSRSSNKLPWVLIWREFLHPRIVNVVSAVKAERAEHVHDRGGGALAHHSSRAEAEMEQTIVVETEVYPAHFMRLK